MCLWIVSGTADKGRGTVKLQGRSPDAGTRDCERMGRADAGRQDAEAGGQNM